MNTGQPARHAPVDALRFALATCLFCASAAATAETGDREKPINYTADNGDVNYQTKLGTLNGNVIITQGTLTVRADRVVFRQNPDNSLSVTAVGNPVSFRQKRDNVDEYYEGFAQRAEYDGQKTLLELFDRAYLRRGQDEIRSNYISYNTGTEIFKAEGRPPKTPSPEETGATSRVRGVFQPKGGDFPGGKGAPSGKDAPKAAAKDAPRTAADTAPLTLKPAGELAPQPAPK